jgi:pimeloyl-ACP methyl ester carboxylesterase
MLRQPRQTSLVLVAFVFAGSALAWGRAQPLSPGAVAQDSKKLCAQLVSVRTPDGVRLDGLLTKPLGKPRAAALLLVHGFGANFYEAYFPAFARAAAARGYLSLALNMRDHGRGPKISDFADNQTDIAAGLTYLRGLGHSRFILLGQSMGTNRVLYYEAASHDPSVVATVLVSGPGNLFEWNVWQFGRKKAQASVDEALARQAAGRSNETMLVDLGPLGKALYTPRYLLSLRGPEAPSNPYRNIRSVTGPILIVQGTADRLIEPGVGARLKQAAISSKAVDLVRIEGAGHAFAGHEAELAARVISWLAQQPGAAQ